MSAHHVIDGEEKEEVVESLVDCLGGENDEGEDVTDETKAGNNSKEDTTQEERHSTEPGRGLVMVMVNLGINTLNRVVKLGTKLTTDTVVLNIPQFFLEYLISKVR